MRTPSSAHWQANLRLSTISCDKQTQQADLFVLDRK
jgi:hypothetical protein